jgi:hypothetical protein
MKPQKSGSAVLRAFLAPAPPCGEDFARKALPGEWEPRRLFAEPAYPLERGRRRCAYVTARLGRFRYAERFERDPLEFALSLREPLTAWLARVEGVELRVLSSTASAGSAHCLCRYVLGPIVGEYNVWILPVDETTAHLVAAVSEGRDREARLDGPWARSVRHRRRR